MIFALVFREKRDYPSAMSKPVVTNREKIAVVIVAAGRGERAAVAGQGPKQYRGVGGKAIIAHTIEAFAGHEAIGAIVVAIHPDDDRLFAQAAGPLAGRVTLVHGGATRQESTRLALLALAPSPPQAVLIHDAVRPFVDCRLIDRVIEAIDDDRGALPALPVADTLKSSSDDDMVLHTVVRDSLRAAQTPQGFPFAPILAAHEQARRQGLSTFTDDAAIAEWAGIPIRLVAGSSDNIKLTWAADLALAERKFAISHDLFPDVRTGNGYDVHCLEAGDHVTLCGISIPHDKRLCGHSDADVALHALTDALLATCGAGDIGSHFPPSDSQWLGAASRIFVEHAAGIVRAHGGRIANVDITLICEAPRIGPHRQAMAEAVAKMTGIAIERVSIKATTNEKLGFIGRDEGIAAIATASVVFPGSLPP